MLLACKDPRAPSPFPKPTEKQVDSGLCQVPRRQQGIGKGAWKGPAKGPGPPHTPQPPSPLLTVAPTPHNLPRELPEAWVIV